MLVYAMTLYTVTAYAVMSLIQIQPIPLRVKIQKISLSSPLCAAPVDLLNPPYLQVLHSEIWLAKMGCNCLFCFPCSYVGAVSIHPHM